MIINRIINWFSGWPDALKFLVLISITVAVTYFSNSPFKVVWYIILLLLYYLSDNEALWLAFFLSTVDGFMGFFGLYAVTLTILPGLPALELAQIYVLISVVKAVARKGRILVFYSKYLQILFLYMLFLILWGQMMGISGELNVYLRVVKGIIPMFLLYSIPRLFRIQRTYDRFFTLVFLITLLAFATQIFTLMTGVLPMVKWGGSDGGVVDDGEFRVFFNASTTLLGYFGALYYLNRKGGNTINQLLCYAVVLAALGMAVLSATRGWIISFSVIIFLTLVFTGTMGFRRMVGLSLISIPLLIWALSNPIINKQVAFSGERLGDLEAITQGDLSARGTLQRLSYRSDRVMGAWKQNPVFGWGLSDMGYRYGDGHVGNQSLLAMSGVLGFILLNGFLIYFAYKIFYIYQISGKHFPDRKAFLVFIFFLSGWFIIHSSSGQQFNYIGMPVNIIPQAVFFSFGAFRYERSLKLIYGKKV